MIGSYKPHIVHTHTAKAGFLGRTAALLSNPRPALVHTFHGHVLDGYFGPWKSSLFREIERSLAGQTDVIVAVADSVRRELVGRHGVGEHSQYRVIPSGGQADASQEKAAPGASLKKELSLGPGPVAGVVGRLVPIKGLDTVLKSLPTIVEEIPFLKVVLAGDGPGRKMVEAFQRRNEAGRALLFLGNRDDVDEIIPLCDLIILPSLKEGLPTILLEAAAAGVPVVASRIPGVTELFENESSALLFEPRSPAELAAAVVRLCRDPKLGARLSRAARKAVRGVMSPGGVVAAHRDLYRDLYTERKGRLQ